MPIDRPLNLDDCEAFTSASCACRVTSLVCTGFIIVASCHAINFADCRTVAEIKTRARDRARCCPTSCDPRAAIQFDLEAGLCERMRERCSLLAFKTRWRPCRVGCAGFALISEFYRRVAPPWRPEAQLSTCAHCATLSPAHNPLACGLVV